MKRLIVAVLAVIAFTLPAMAQSNRINNSVPMPKEKPAAASSASSSDTTAPKKMTVDEASNNLITLIQSFTLTDLNAALADANAQTPPDATAAACWTALIALRNNPSINPLPTTPGTFEFVQKGRDDKTLLASLVSPNGPFSGVVTACAPVAMDVKATIVGIALQAGIVAGAAANPAAAAGLVGVGAGLTALKAAFGIP